jgi:acetyl esterase
MACAVFREPATLSATPQRQDNMLDPLAKTFIDQMMALGRPKIWQMSVGEARRNAASVMKLFGAHDVPIGKVDNITMPGPGGDLRLRVYSPVAAGSESLPAMIFFHGGGFTIGDLDTHDGSCRLFTRESGCRVIAVDYRLGPEHKFPAAVDDAFAAVRWVEENASGLGIDANRIAVGGDSAGGNLSAVVCQLAKSDGGPKIAYQLLMFPMTQFGAAFASLRRFGAGFLLERQSLDWFTQNYLPDDVDINDPRISPLQSPDMSGLPPAYVMLAGCDPLHDEGLAYAEKLSATGVSVSVADYPGMVHSFVHMQAVLPQASEALSRAAKAMRQALDAV